MYEGKTKTRQQQLTSLWSSSTQTRQQRGQEANRSCSLGKAEGIPEKRAQGEARGSQEPLRGHLKENGTSTPIEGTQSGNVSGWTGQPDRKAA